MIWLVVAVIVAAAVIGGLAYARQGRTIDYRTLAKLHRVRQGLNLAHYKVEVRRDASRLRRELRAKLERDEDA